MSDNLIREFTDDAREHLAEAGRHLLGLEKGGRRSRDINGLLRRLHSIKGNSGFLGLNSIYNLLHKTENTLQHIREKGVKQHNKRLIDVLFQVLDTLEIMIQKVDDGKADSVEWLPRLHESLDNLDMELQSQSNDKGNGQSPTLDHTAFFKNRATDQQRETLENKIEQRPDHFVLILQDEDFENNGAGLVRLLIQTLSIENKKPVFDLRNISSLKSDCLTLLVNALKQAPGLSTGGLIVKEDKEKGLTRVLKLKGLDQVLSLHSDE